MAFDKYKKNKKIKGIFYTFLYFFREKQGGKIKSLVNLEGSGANWHQWGLFP